MKETKEAAGTLKRQLAFCLLVLRRGIAVVFVMWTVDKFVNPEHSAKVFEKFYKIPSLSPELAYGVGAAQSVLLTAFILWGFRTYSYGEILVLHAISTLSSYNNYLDPWTYPNLLFFAAIPMLLACIAIWVLRRHDLYSVDEMRVGRAA
jgi:putative oxidoreductase